LRAAFFATYKIMSSRTPLGVRDLQLLSHLPL
jgi:hypothetical protein